jgi:hypothetical protein
MPRVNSHVIGFDVLVLCVLFAAATFIPAMITPVVAVTRVRAHAVEFGVDTATNTADAAFRHVGDHTVEMDSGGTFNATVLAADTLRVSSGAQLLVDNVPIMRSVRAVQTVADYRPRTCCSGAADMVPGVEVVFTPVAGRMYMVSATCRLTTEHTNSNSGPQNFVTMFLATDGFDPMPTRAAFNWANVHMIDHTGPDYTTARIHGLASPTELGGAGTAHTYRLGFYKSASDDLFAQYCELSVVEFPDVLLT